MRLHEYSWTCSWTPLSRCRPLRRNKGPPDLRPSYKTCSCMPIVGHATGPISLDGVPSDQTRVHPSCDHGLRHVVACLVWDMQLVPLPVQQKMEVELQPSYKTCSCDQVRRHAVACLVWDMQLAPSSLEDTPSDKKQRSPSCVQVRRHAVACLLWDMQLAPSLSTPPLPTKTKAPQLRPS